MSTAKCVSMVGFGNLGRIIAEGIYSGLAGPYEIVAAYDVYAGEEARDFAQKLNIQLSNNLDEVLAQKPDYIIEAACAEVLVNVAVPCLTAGANMIILSTGAFADKAFWDDVSQVASRQGRKVFIASGAIGGFDLAQAAKIVGNLKATIMTEKPPKSLIGAPALNGRSLAEDCETLVFDGNAREAFAGFPKNLNVAVALSLATVGVDKLNVIVKSNPKLSRNKHTITLDGEFGKAKLEIDLAQSPNNPKSAVLAAYSVLNALHQIAAPIQM